MKTKGNWEMFVLNIALSIGVLGVLIAVSILEIPNHNIFTLPTASAAAAETEYLNARQPLTDDMEIQTAALNSWLDLASDNPSLLLFESWRTTAYERLDEISADFDGIHGLTPPAAWEDDHQKLIESADEFEVAKEILISGIQGHDQESIELGMSHLRVMNDLLDAE